MEEDIFEFEEQRLELEIKKRGAKRVLLQLPEGLKPEGPRLAAVIERAGATAIISGDPCYGACDIAITEAQDLEADLIVHYGHTMMMKHTRIPVVYFEAHARIPIKRVVEKAIRLLKPWRRIGLVTTIQHIRRLDEAKRILSSAGKDVHIGEGCGGLYPGQVLGCNYLNAKTVASEVEAFLFLGGGRFHPLGLALATMKPVVAADPFEEKVYSLDAYARRILRRRWAEIEEARGAEIYGVIVGLKPGQKRLEEAFEVRDMLKREGKKPYLLALREITAPSLSQFPIIEAYINTACPRISLDEPSIFPRPVLTLKETYVMLGKKRWEDLLEEGLI